MPYILHQLQGLTYLGLSYSSDELMKLCQSHRGPRYTSGRSGSNLQTFSLECTLSALHRQVGLLSTKRTYCICLIWDVATCS